MVYWKISSFVFRFFRDLASSLGQQSRDILDNQNLRYCAVTYLKEGKLIVFSVVVIARAIAYSEPSCCSDGLQTGKTSNDIDDRRTPISLDYVRRTVLVEVRDLIVIKSLHREELLCFLNIGLRDKALSLLVTLHVARRSAQRIYIQCLLLSQWSVLIHVVMSYVCFFCMYFNKSPMINKVFLCPPPNYIKFAHCQCLSIF